ncbi:vWA domain-containing protein [Tomitella fengzijianii]|uniref:vWA domain-containing protein n=1 Tax=Tomitella fengzijianii TaxID=2597660 RepID=UPI00131DC1F0|nr:VWA domain-containing protein [Tomitella fengzijianii]
MTNPRNPRRRPPSGPLAPHGIPGHLVGFVGALRGRGIAVGTSETVDAGRVLAVLDPLDREAVREGLASALLRRPVHRDIFDVLFDLWFPSGIGARRDGPDGADASADGEGGAQPGELPVDEDGNLDGQALEDLLADLLADESADGRDRLDRLVADIVDRLGRYEGYSGESFSAYQAMRGLSGDNILRRLLDGVLGPSAEEPGHREVHRNEVALRTALERMGRLRRMVQTETRRRSAEKLGRDRVAQYGVPQLAEQVDFLRASDADLQALRKTMVPLARALATRLAARRRRSRRGEIDVRRTLRKSMSTGGVPIDLVLRKPRPARPELVVLCDVSGSVAGFSHFTLQLVHTLREQFSRVRIFAFIDTTDEVSTYFEAGSDLGVAMSRMVREARLITYDGHSDYGNALGGFAENHAHALTDKSSLLILGDARTNYRDPNLAALQRMSHAARQTHWLNPEPAAQWGTGDSVATAYGTVVPMYECRTAEQLTGVISRLLPI